MPKTANYTPDLVSEALFPYRSSLDPLDPVVPVSATVLLVAFSYAISTLVVRMIPLYVMISSSDPDGDTLRISVCWCRDPRKSFRCMFSWLFDLNPCVPRVLLPYRSPYGVPDATPELPPKSEGNHLRKSGRRAGIEAQIMAIFVSTAPQTGRTV